jgi:hypothetical protein
MMTKTSDNPIAQRVHNFVSLISCFSSIEIEAIVSICADSGKALNPS